MAFNKNLGGALLTALFIMTLVAIVATAMSLRIQTDIHRTRILIAHDKMYLASQAVSFWSSNELRDPKNQFTQLLDDGSIAQLPKDIQNIIPQITLEGGLYDLQSRFNINSASDTKYIMNFINLLIQTIPNIDRVQAANITLALKDWLSPYDPSRGVDVYTSYYQGQNPPYYPSHQLMQSTSEFRLLKGVTGSIYQALEPYITALPETTPININTASKPVIMSLVNGMTDSKYSELIQLRGQMGFTDQKNLNDAAQKINIPLQQITTESQYFLCVAKVNMDDSTLIVHTVLKRTKDKDKKITVRILSVSKMVTTTQS